jgi:hypothetical protein
MIIGLLRYPDGRLLENDAHGEWAGWDEYVEKVGQEIARNEAAEVA